MQSQRSRTSPMKRQSSGLETRESQLKETSRRNLLVVREEEETALGFHQAADVFLEAGDS